MGIEDFTTNDELAEILKDFRLVDNKLVVGYEIKDGKIIPVITVTTTYKQYKQKNRK